MNFKYAGINQLHNIPTSSLEHLNIVLKAHGHLHYPYVRGTPIHVHMVKIIHIPIAVLPTILEFATKANQVNTFYVWKGHLKSEMNEGLIIINISSKNTERLKRLIDKPTKLRKFLVSNQAALDSFDPGTLSFFRMLIDLDVRDQIDIEAPFAYQPYVNLNAGNGSVNGKRIFPIGDSLFCGHPKVGNGLGRHLRLITELVGKMAKRQPPTS